MPGYHVATSYVSTGVLETIVSGNYERQLSAEESALLERVPSGIRQWFERVVIAEFYVPLRGITKQPLDMLAQLIDEILPLEATQGQSDGDGKKKGLTLRGRFEYRKKHTTFSHLINHTGNGIFEGLLETALLDYKGRVVNVIQVSLSSGFPFKYKYVPHHEVIASVASRMR